MVGEGAATGHSTFVGDPTERDAPDSLFTVHVLALPLRSGTSAPLVSCSASVCECAELGAKGLLPADGGVTD